MSLKGWSFLVAAMVSLVAVAGAGAAYGQPNPCTLLTPAQIDAAIGDPVGPGQAVGTTMCQWSAANQPNTIQGKKVAVVLLTAQGYANAKMPVNDPVITKTAVSGIGDEAVYGTAAGRAASLSVKKGGNYFSVRIAGYSMEQLQHMETVLATQVAAAL
jgi:hypothetical protein